MRNLSRIHEGTFSPNQFLLAVYEGEVVGYCQYEGEHFGPFGVAQGFQSRGIGTVLLGWALRSMAQQGLHNAWVLWTGEDVARLYARFGFKESRRFAILHKDEPEKGSASAQILSGGLKLGQKVFHHPDFST